jgi:anti-sigma B factor antagonist
VGRVDDLQALTVTTAQFGADSYLVTFGGELDLHTSAAAERELDAVLERGARKLVVDLCGVSFLGSVGLRILTVAAKRTRADGGECVVVSDDPRILRVFEITGLDRTLRIEHSLLEAINELVDLRPRVAL